MDTLDLIEEKNLLKNEIRQLQIKIRKYELFKEQYNKSNMVLEEPKDISVDQYISSEISKIEGRLRDRQNLLSYVEILLSKGIRYSDSAEFYM